MSVVLPGEAIAIQHVNLKLGAGLLQRSDAKGNGSIVSDRAGVLSHSANKSKWWIETNARRYVPALQESVIGVVAGRLGEGHRVDIGSAHSASLDGLAFEGATKRNRPNLKVGALVHARVSLAHKDMDPELECFNAQTRKADGFGELKGGFMTRYSLMMCRRLLDPKHFLLPMLGARFPFEVVVGMNGRVWINAKDVKQVIAVIRCIEVADPEGGDSDESSIKKFLNTLDL